MITEDLLMALVGIIVFLLWIVLWARYKFKEDSP